MFQLHIVSLLDLLVRGAVTHTVAILPLKAHAIPKIHQPLCVLIAVAMISGVFNICKIRNEIIIR